MFETIKNKSISGSDPSEMLREEKNFKKVKFAQVIFAAKQFLRVGKLKLGER